MKIIKKKVILLFRLALGFAIFLNLASCTKAKQEYKRPNILVAIMDDASMEHIGAYGCQWVNTPSMDRLATNGILFSNAYTPNAKCAPSRASILTGRNSWQLESAANHYCYFPNKFKTYSEALAEKGYHVGYTGKGWAPGVVGKVNGKKRKLTGKSYNKIKKSPPTTSINKTDYVANFIEFLDSRKEGSPFLFWFGSKEPHRSYEYGSGISKGGKKKSDIDSVYSFWPDCDTVRTDLLDYAFEIEYFDTCLNKIIDELEKRNELENTLIVVTSDNGMPFPRIKGQEYEFSNHMPLIVMWPKGIKRPGRRIDDFISFIDLAPTFLELAEIPESESGMQAITGKSLTSIFYSRKEGVIDTQRNHVLIGKERHDVGRPHDWGYPIRGIRKGDYLYIHNFEPSRWPAGNPETGYLNCDGSPTKTICIDTKDRDSTQQYWQWSFGKRAEYELYDVKNDPECMTNLYKDSAYRSIANLLQSQLIKELTEQQGPRILGHGEVFDTIKYAKPSNRNFYERYQNKEAMEAGWVNSSDFQKMP
ncbi:sulfatase family protein [Marinifilum caeruleilacunae]|uniref:Heparan N-sulfatase n=1 Tax=Marinifilum caeruleilacunae TaxID=2499076 RepID=A0ABX1WRK8_9BACT|nr:sulfatase [Marinifilum caeruleilacunae]NOU58722.1 heparan N-sulfatase [Marinifilum caeruleilacunae]